MRWILFMPILLGDLWLAYLCTRWHFPRIPGQRRVYRPVPLGTLVVFVPMAGLTNWLGFGALREGVLFLLPVLWMFFAFFLGVLTLGVSAAFAFSQEEIALRGVFGPVRTCPWTEITTCTVRRREGRGRGIYHSYDEYRLTLPTGTLTLSGAEDAGIEFLQLLERNRPDLPIRKVPER